MKTLTKKQREIIEICERIIPKDYSHLKECFTEGDFIMITYHNFDSDIYHVKSYSKKYYANTNIITADFPYKNEVIKINNIDIIEYIK